MPLNKRGHEHFQRDEESRRFSRAVQNLVNTFSLGYGLGAVVPKISQPGTQTSANYSIMLRD
jgi:hypothetical protein